MSQIIIDIGDAPDDGQGTQLRQAFADINTMMTAIYAAGPVDSNVQIANNQITTTVTNANLVLAPSGIGIVRVTNHLVPNVDDVYDLGSFYPELLRWNTIWVGTGGINTDGSMTVGGNLTVDGIISGDGSGLTNVSANVGSAQLIQNGNTQLNIPTANGNIVANVQGVSNVLTISTTGLNVSANIKAVNVIGDNFFYGNGQSIFANVLSNISVGANTGLVYSANTLNTIYNTTVADSVDSVAVGGASPAPASTWKTLNLVQVLNTILFPDIDPTYTIPTIALTGSVSGIREIGDTISQGLTVSAVKNDAGAYTALRAFRGGTELANAIPPASSAAANIPSQFGYSDPNNPNFSYQLNYTDSVVVPAGTTSWSGQGSYGNGLPKLNNKGSTDARTPAVRSINAPQASANITSSTTTVTGIYPYFYGKSMSQPTATSIAAAIQAGSTSKVLASAADTVSVTYDASGEFVWMAHQADYTSKTVWYFTDYNQGTMGPDNFILNPETQNVNSPEGYWSGIQFKIYISGYATYTEGELQYRNS